MKIGITYTGSADKHHNYQQWIEQDGAAGTVLLRPGVEIHHLDGLVLSGGTDIDPSFYNGDTRYPNKPEAWEKERDQYELSALRYAFENKIPVLGICRGLQLINVFCGGTLKQDLGTELNAVHKATGDIDRKHSVAIEKESLLHEMTGQDAGQVNSAHHQAIDILGKGLIVNARSDHGIIEGIEFKEASEKPFMLAVQWHPERMYTNHLPDAALYMAVRERFIQEIHKNKI